MTKILVATIKPFAPAAVEEIKNISEKAGYDIQVLEKYADKSEMIKAVEDATALIVRSDAVDQEVIDAGKNLKIIVRAGAGYDNIDLKAASDKDIVVMNTPGQNANAVAELALGMMVYLARNLYNGKPGTELRGKKLGVFAFGNVGKCVAEIALGLKMDVYAYSSKPKETIEKACVKPLGSAEELFKTCQYISLHIPANEKTIKSINYELMSKMPENAVLVNTARKEIIDEEGLLKMFAERPDFKYISDIAPDCCDEIEKEYPGRFFFTPKKMGAQTSEANINAGIAAANQIVNYLKKGDTTFKVN